MVVPSPHDAVDALYRAFAQRMRPSRLDASAAKDPSIATKLLAAPLRQADADAILRYSGSAMTTIGEVEDFAYFLPRILEVAIDGPFARLAEPFMIAGKLESAGWRSWSAAEQGAIADAFRSAFRRLRVVDPDQADAFLWLAAMTRAGIDLRPALDGWLREPGPAPLRQLAECIVALAAQLESEVIEAYRPDRLRELIGWLTSDATQMTLLERFDEVPPGRAHGLNQAAIVLPVLAQSPFA